MPTIQQLIRTRRQPIENKTKSPALRGCPQRRGVCTRVYARLVMIRNFSIIKKFGIAEGFFLEIINRSFI